MVNAINKYSQILYLSAKFLKVVILRLYGCEETSLELIPWTKKKRPFPSSTSPTHKIDVIDLIDTCFRILFTIVGSLIS